MALLDHSKFGTYHTPQKLCWPVSIFSALPSSPRLFYKGRELDQHKTYLLFQFALQARLRRKVTNQPFLIPPQEIPAFKYKSI